MASAIGTTLFSTILPPMASKAMDIIKDNAKGKAKVKIEREISGLQTTLSMIQHIVQVVEEKQIDYVFAQIWLHNLVDIAYEARDVLDEFITFSSCTITAKEASKPVNTISSLMQYFSGSSKLPPATLSRLKKDIRSVKERFDEKIKESETFTKLKSVVEGGGFESVRVNRRPEVRPSINRGALFLGREKVKEEIMEKILNLSDDNRVHAVAIWGIGGIGKTTLAQSIYNDERVKEGYYGTKNRRWLCVGKNKFSAEEIITKIIDDSSTTNDVESLQKKLVEKYRNNRFLIVLDDVWDVDGREWNVLFSPLTNVGKGGLIIITTRIGMVCAATITQTTYCLMPLSKEDSWSLFDSCAYKDGKSDSTSKLKCIGKEIVKKLNGLPLALKVVGCSLLDKDSITWTNFLESKLTKDGEVMSALRWSYNHLPRHLKRCFTYCALFPKDHVFDKKLLVQMWMAHDLIQKEKQKQPEDVGADYFEELVNASLLQCVDGKHVMHDLIHDLALLVSNGEFASANSSLIITIDRLEKVRHITIIPGDYSEIPHLCEIKKLLTLYTMPADIYPYEKSVFDDVFKQLKSIRVLVLVSTIITDIAGCISKLKHLRYLDVGETCVGNLPNSLCHLYNLQMLAAPYAKLPRDIVKMVNLRYIRANLSTCMGVGKLTSLQELSSIHVCEGDNIRELKDMQRLRGKLTIKGLGNVEKLEGDVSALMDEQTLMDELVLEFDQQLEKSTISKEVLDSLGCPPNLTYLKIYDYTGLEPPSWMVDGTHKFDKLQTLELLGCPKLEFLPPLGELISLKHLSLWNVGVKRLGVEFYGKITDDKVFFSSLESLVFKEMYEWEEWDDNIMSNISLSFFPSLIRLEIHRCPKLIELPVVKEHPTINAANFMTSLSRLEISSCKRLRSLPADGLPPFLIHLTIKGCPLLYERYNSESGPDRHKINHIPWTDISLLDDEEEEEEKEEDQDDDHSDDDLLFETKIMASAIGTAMVSTILQPMAAKAMDIIKDKGLEIVNIESDISNLQITLRMIQGIVQVAEEKQIDDVLIQNWLRNLVDIAYEARDVLDDFNTFSSCVITAYVETSNPVDIRSVKERFDIKSVTERFDELKKDIRSVRERFDEKKKEAEELKTLISVVGEDSESVKNRTPKVGPFINKQSDHKFEERKEMKEEIMQKILHPSDDRVHVVVIWGMGGIGKTTLTQSIYDDERVKELPRSWFCVGENKFSTEKVIKEILNDKKTIGIGNLQTKLKEKLKGDRFLIVLDDVWDVDGSEWDLLFNPLTNVGKGGLIIITKREREVCPAITIQTAYNLKPLSEKESWLIFESCAYLNGKSDSLPDPKGIGKEIVKKLNGHPLALKVVGCSLLNKDYSTWTNFLKSNEWMLRKEDDVMSALIRSYNHLPSHIKMCFLHCSLFPKDHVFIEKVLVEMWMAHDLIQKEEQKQPEDVGYFQELVNASLLQRVNGKYVMHDMIHDLALFVSNEEFATANGLLSTDQMERVRHISITPGGYSVILNLHKIEKLLTLYTICSDEYINWFDDSVLDDVFKQLKSIRVLVLSSEWIYEIPDCISELKHLRYLDVSQTSVKSLPDSLCHLYNLQMIAAPPDVVLPRDVVNMVNLRYIRATLSTCKGVEKLTSLQELSSICVYEGDNIRELGDMQLLRGKLTIKGLENAEKLEGDVGSLMEKQTLMDELELIFDQQLEKSTISAQVLDALGCPRNLKCLKIYGYSGVKPPCWKVDGKHKFDKLKTLELYDCPKLESLPPLGELTSLKRLSLWEVGVKRLGKEFYGKFTDSKICFPYLESLCFSNMEEWEEWDDIIIENSSVSFFPRLTRLEIHRCPKLLKVLPIKEREDDEHLIMNAANFMIFLSRLEICDCGGLKRLQLDALVSLKELTIARCSSLVEITSGLVERQIETMDFKEPALTLLDVSSCYNLISIPRLVGLKFLNLYGCQSVRSVSIHGLDSLEQLNINNCPVLELIFEKGSSSSSSSGNSVAVGLQICTDKKLNFTKLFQHKFDSLKSLHIESVIEFENFGKTEYDFCNLRSLKSLCISRCKDLKSLPAHFHKLSSLSSLKIENCPELQSLPPDFHKLSSLSNIKIVDCPKLQSLPVSGFPPSMKSLELLNCPLLYERCKDESGFDWHKIKHIPKLTIFGDHKVHRYGGDR